MDVTHARETCTGNLIAANRSRRSSMQVKPETFKHSRPIKIKPRSFGHVRQCKFLQVQVSWACVTAIRYPERVNWSALNTCLFGNHSPEVDQWFARWRGGEWTAFDWKRREKVVVIIHTVYRQPVSPSDPLKLNLLVRACRDHCKLLLRFRSDDRVTFGALGDRKHCQKNDVGIM